jgi:mercuric ion binding protein
MKTLKSISIAILAVLLNVNSFAQMTDHSKMAATKTETIKVSGNCDMCKTRIEKAAKIPGVIKANWDSKTQILALTYDPSKAKSDEVQKKIAAVGHDTPKFKADKKTYDALPGCCQYR